MTDTPFNQPLGGNKMPRFGGIATMMRLPHATSPQGLDVGFIGIPLDIGTSHRPGARFGPRQIRAESCLIRPYNMATGAAPFDSLQVADLGDVPINTYNLGKSVDIITAHYREVLVAGCIPLTLGGDHTIALPILRAMAAKHGPVALVHVDAHADITQPAGDGGGHRQVAVLGGLLGATQGIGGQAGFLQQVVGQQPGARAGLALHETRAAAHHIAEAAQRLRVAGSHHQALLPAAEADQLVLAGLEQRLERLGEQLGRIGQGRHVEAGDQAAAFGQGAQGIDAARKAQLDVQALHPGGQFAQRGCGMGPVAQRGGADLRRLANPALVGAVVPVPGQAQHLEGGIIGRILVKDGDQVRAGQVLIQLPIRS